MKRLSLNICLALMILSAPAMAQELPAPSPSAEVKQRVGLTDITVNYSRPGVKGRMIWGELVPMNEIWRTGANKATKISFSNDVKIMGQPVPAGEYSVFTIPRDGIFTWILNKDLELWGTGDYDSLKDVLRVEAPADVNPMPVETMHFFFDNVTNDGAVLFLSWGEIRIPMMIEVNDHELAMKNIEQAVSELEEGGWRPYINGANYLKDKGMLEEAIKYAEKGVDASDYWYAHLTLAKIYGNTQRWDDALTSAEMAREKGKKVYDERKKDFSPYEEDIQELVMQWEAEKRAKSKK